MEDINNIDLEKEISRIKLSERGEAVSKKNRSQKVRKGIPSSPGIASGRAFILVNESTFVTNEKIPDYLIDSEINRLNNAIDDLLVDFKSTLDKVKKEAANIVSIIESSNLILSDKFLKDGIEKRIKKGFAVESAIIQEFEEQKSYLSSSNDSILRERAIDLEHIMHQLLAVLRKRIKPVEFPQDSIIIAQSLTPQEIVNLKEAGIKAIVTEVGGIASHTSILARSFEIPSVIGVKNATTSIEQASEIIVDGYAGIVVTNPTPHSKENYLKKIKKDIEYRIKLGDEIKQPAVTIDNFPVKLMTNIDFLEDVHHSIRVGAEGFGLVRSENIIMAYRHFPTEDEQYAWYKEIADRGFPYNVTIRAFDVGSDKFMEGLSHTESNPALGHRGIRFLLKRKEIFFAQVLAILRASKNKNVRLMLPMITNMDEIEKSLEIINKAKEFLKEEKMEFDFNIPVGIMIETPAAALIADKLAQKVDFFSIGTNDLTQYTLAADRTNELVANIYDAFHPAVIKLIKMTVDAAKNNNIPVSICGELAGHSASTSLLIGMGVKEYSVAPSTLLEAKRRIRATDSKIAEELTQKALNCATNTEIRELLEIE